jgi:hypothetical protein
MKRLESERVISPLTVKFDDVMVSRDPKVRLMELWRTMISALTSMSVQEKSVKSLESTCERETMNLGGQLEEAKSIVHFDKPIPLNW